MDDSSIQLSTAQFVLPMSRDSIDNSEAYTNPMITTKQRSFKRNTVSPEEQHDQQYCSTFDRSATGTSNGPTAVATGARAGVVMSDDPDEAALSRLAPMVSNMILGAPLTGLRQFFYVMDPYKAEQFVRYDFFLVRSTYCQLMNCNNHFMIHFVLQSSQAI